MNIQEEHNDKGGRWYIEEGGELIAEMTYINSGKERIIIDHTEVGEALRGQGVGYELVKLAVDRARELKVKILPLCPFAKSVFQKKTEYADVLF